MVFLRQRGKGDATSHYAARWLRLAAAVGSVKWSSSRRPSPTTFVKVTNKAAKARVRKATLELAKLGKEYRKASI